MLLAIGMNRSRIFGMIIIETVLLSLTGGIAGVIFGGLISHYFESHVINMSLCASGLSVMGYDYRIYTSLEPDLLIMVTIMVFFTGIIAAIYPALKALKNDPAEALRTE